MTSLAPEDPIKLHGQNAEAQPSPDSEKLAARLDKVESLIEEAGQRAQFFAEFGDYISDLRAEVASIKAIRFWAVVGAAAFVVFNISMLVCITFYHNNFLWMFTSQFKLYAYVATLASCVFIISIVLRGAFRSISERHGDDLMPPHLKEIVDAAKNVKPSL